MIYGSIPGTNSGGSKLVIAPIVKFVPSSIRAATISARVPLGPMSDHQDKKLPLKTVRFKDPEILEILADALLK